MDQPVAQFKKSTVPNLAIGLNSDKLDESNINGAVWRYVSRKQMAPIPKQNVGACNTMRKRILQMSLFPDIYDKRGKSRSSGNVDFGEAHVIKD
jgi:hypothetical protein